LEKVEVRQMEISNGTKSGKVRPQSHTSPIKLGCLYCGKIVELSRVEKNRVYYCPLCGSPLYRAGGSLKVVTILAIVGVILFGATIFLPVLRLRFPTLEVEQTLSLSDSLVKMFSEGDFIVGVVAVVTLIVIPLSLLLGIAVIGILSETGKGKVIVGQLLEMYVKLKEWNMTEIYLLAILISIIKLAGMGEVQLMVGFYFLLGYLWCFYFATALFSPPDICYRFNFLYN
jgi:paraquat-inducible protein A